MQKSKILCSALVLTFFIVTSAFITDTKTNNDTKLYSDDNPFQRCLNVFPNPADDQAMLKISDDIETTKPVTIQIRLLGSKSIVEEIVIDRYRLMDVSHYPNGMYIATPIIAGVPCSGTRFTVFHK